MPFKDRAAKGELSTLFEVEGIPSLVVLDKVGPDGKRKVINGSARGSVTMSSISDFPWSPKPYANLSETVECNGSDINEDTAIIILCEGADDDEQKEIIETMAKVAEAKKDGMLFFYATSGAGPVGKVRELCSLKDDGEIIMMKLDIPDSGGFYVADKGTEISEASILAFMENSGERQQLKR